MAPRASSPSTSPLKLSSYESAVCLPAHHEGEGGRLSAVRMSHIFPENSDCCYKFRLRLRQVGAGRVALQLRHWTPLCRDLAAAHTFPCTITGHCGSVGFKKSWRRLSVRCHRWTTVAFMAGDATHEFHCQIHIQVPGSGGGPRRFPALCGARSLADVSLRGARGERRAVHSTVLAVHSQLYRSMNMTNRTSVHLKADSETLSQLINFMYHGRAPTARLWSLLLLARDLRMRALTRTILGILMGTMCSVSAPKLLRRAQEIKCSTLFTAAACYIRDHCSEVLDEGIKDMEADNAVKSSWMDNFEEEEQDVMFSPFADYSDSDVYNSISGKDTFMCQNEGQGLETVRESPFRFES